MLEDDFLNFVTLEKLVQTPVKSYAIVLRHLKVR